MKIAVYGSAAGDIDDKVKQMARELGKKIAENGHELITGGCTGLPYEAVLGAKSGRTIAYSPATDLQAHKEVFGFPTEGFSEFVFIPEGFPYKEDKRVCLKLRNILSVDACDAAVIISGRCGTLNEFTLAYDLGKNIGVLVGTGGMTKYIKNLVEDWNKPSASTIIYDSNPRVLIEKLEKLG